LIQITSAISRTDMKTKNYTNVKMKNMQDTPTEPGTKMTMFLSPMVTLMASALKNRNIK
jgi:hypothetical protein